MTQFNTHAHIRNTFHLTAALMLSGIGAAQTTQGAATHASSTVLAQVQQTPAVAPVKAAIDGAMVMDDRGPSCCPAVMTGPFSQYFAYDQLSGKNMTQSYGLKFLSDFVYVRFPPRSVQSNCT